MITKEELGALVQLLNRTPMSVAEQLWTAMFLTKLQAQIPLEKKQDKQEETK